MIYVGWLGQVAAKGSKDLEGGVSEEEMEGHGDELWWEKRGDKGFKKDTRRSGMRVNERSKNAFSDGNFATVDKPL